MDFVYQKIQTSVYIQILKKIIIEYLFPKINPVYKRFFNKELSKEEGEFAV